MHSSAHTQGGVSRESSQSAASPSLALKSGARGLRLLMRLSQYADVSAKKSIHFCDAASTDCAQTRWYSVIVLVNGIVGMVWQGVIKPSLQACS